MHTKNTQKVKGRGRKLSAFTLVELIVVITILAILATIGFIGYSNYIIGARDSARVQALKNMSESLTAYSTNKSLPYPEDKIEIKIGTAQNEKTIAYQGKAGEKVIEIIQYAGTGVDPKDGSYYSYYVTKSRNHFQLMAFLEDSSNLQNTKKTAFTSPHPSTANQLQNSRLATPFFTCPTGERVIGLPKTYAANIDYSDRYPTVWGEKLGILTDTNNTPIEDIDSIKTAGELNISNTTDTYIARIKDGEEPIEGTGGTLIAINPEASCKRLFEAKGIRADGVYKIDPEGNGTGFKVYCDMTTDGGGWTLVMRDFSNNRISSSEDSIKNPFSASSASLGNVSNKNSKYKLDTHILGTKNSKILFKGWNIGQNVDHYVEAGKFNYVIVNKSLKEFAGENKDNCNNYTYENSDCDFKNMTVDYDSRGGNLTFKHYWFGDTISVASKNFYNQYSSAANYNYIWHEKGWIAPSSKTGTDPTTIKREVFIR